MTKLLDRAFEAARLLRPEEQDEIARAILALADVEAQGVPLTAEERAAIAHSKAAAERSEFATDQEVRDVWAKHGL